MTEKKKPSINVYDLKGSIPPYNVKSTIVPCTETPYVFLYGGFDHYDDLDSNVYLLDTSTMTWEIDNKVDGLFREGHLAIYIGNGNILVFGGVPFDDDVSINASFTGEVKTGALMMIYNVFDKKWIGPPSFALENCPSSRSRHACCLSEDGSKMYISGGLVKSTPLDDLYIYDLMTGIWLGPIPFVCRFDHTILAYKDRIFSFGGLEKNMNHARSITYYSLNTGTMGEVFLNTGDKTREFNEFSVLRSNINSSICLKVNLPSWNYPNNQLKVSCFNFSNFETTDLLNQRTLDYYFHAQKEIIQCHWKSVFVHHDGKLYFLGKKKDKSIHPFGGYLNNEEQINGVNVTDNHNDDDDDDDDDTTPNDDIQVHTLNFMLEINMQKFGISNRVENLLSRDFLGLLTQQEFTDFEIVCLENEEAKQAYENQQQGYTTKSIPVHKTILIARWPHFHRMLSAGMNEAIENKMFLPEPYTRVKALIYFLYVGSIDFDAKLVEDLSILDYTGLLVMANMYELQELQSLVVMKLFNLFHNFQFKFNDGSEDDISLLLKIWKYLSFSDERIFMSTIIDLIKKKWSSITRSQTFLNLSKDEIVKLCQDSTDENINSTHGNKSPINSIRSVDTNELVTISPARHTHSPFVLDSPANHSTLFNDP